MRRWIYCLICLVTTLLISSWSFAQPPPINSVGGELTPGEQYDAVISDILTTGRFFGGGAKIAVVQPPGKGKKN